MPANTLSAVIDLLRLMQPRPSANEAEVVAKIRALEKMAK